MKEAFRKLVLESEEEKFKMYANRTMKKKKFEKEKSKVTYDNNNGRAKEINMNCKDAHECKNRICKFSHPWEYDWVDQQAVE